jgi:hypothetical protein
MLITANPPFLPVPPAIVQTRHGLFSAGGPSGESVLASIVHLASQLLPPTNGYLAVVSEFFLQQEEDEPDMNDKDDGADDANNNNNNPHTDNDTDADGTNDKTKPTPTPTSTAAAALLDRMKTWWGPVAGRGLLLTNQFPVSAATYAERRADSPHEERIWLEHLQDLDIAAASPGLLYIQKQQQRTTTATKHNKHRECKHENDNKGDRDNCSGDNGDDDNDDGILELRHMKVPKSKWGSIWTPSNPAGVEFTQSVCQQFFDDDGKDDTYQHETVEGSGENNGESKTDDS